MNLVEKYQKIGLKLANRFPEYYHVFSHGAFTADIGRNGGIDFLGFIDVRKEGDMMFPNRWISSVLNRDNWHLERPMYGPAVKILSLTHEGTVYYHAPEKGRLLPYGVIATNEDSDFGCSIFHLFLERDRSLRVILKNTSHVFETLEIVISKYHLASGKYMIRQNQLLEHEYGVEMLSPGQLYDSYLRQAPFPNVHGVLNWEKIYFDDAHNTLIFSGMRNFEDGKKSPLYMVFGCSEKCTFEESEQNWCLKCHWNEQSGMAASIVIGETLPDLIKKASWDCATTEKRLEELLTESGNGENASPAISISGVPEASDFARVVRNAQSAITIEDTGKYAAILAASSVYGYFIAWDHNYPIRDFITTGDFETAKRLLRYGIDYPHMKTVAFSVSQLILEVNELIAFEGNMEFLKGFWTKLLDEFEFLENYIDPATGLLKSPHCCGVDIPAEVGLSKYFYAACLNAWHYAASRVMANFALLMNDEKNALRYMNAANKLKENYLKYFYNEDKGALRVAVNENLSIPRIEIFHNSSSIGLDYPYGEFLLGRALRPLAHYYKTKLHHPDGYTALSYDSESPCEMWRSVYMNQHLGHNTRIARLAGDGKEALRVARHYFHEFDATKTAIETFNLGGCHGDVTQRTKWQAFSTTGALHCLHQSLAGIAWSRGGLVYLPSADEQKVEIRNFNFGGKIWHISVEGAGAFVSSMKLNGVTFSGSMQIPLELLDSHECRWEIVRSQIPWEKPTLLYITDIPIQNVTETDCGIKFTVAGDAFSPMKFYAADTVKVVINEQTVPVEYFAAEQTAWIDFRFHHGVQVECYYQR